MTKFTYVQNQFQKRNLGAYELVIKFYKYGKVLCDYH